MNAVVARALRGQSLPRIRYASEGRNYQQLAASDREYVLNRDGRKCSYCRLDESELLEIAAKTEPRGALHGVLHVDHIIPRCRGGTNDAWNLAAACWRCNSSKHGKWRPEDRALLWQKVVYEGSPPYLARPPTDEPVEPPAFAVEMSARLAERVAA